MPRALFIIAWIALALAAFWSFCLDGENVAQGGAIDLRNRITGVRLLEDQVDPYHYKWHEPEPDIYLDPYNNPHVPVSKTTVTPPLLLLHAPLAALPYRLGEVVWFFLQWALLLGTAGIWWRRLPHSGPRLLFAAFLVGFTYTAAWRLHAERGQIYVLYLFLFAAWLAATASDKGRFLTGFLAGFLVTLRPPFALLIPFLALHRRGQIPGAVAGLLTGIVVPLFFLGTCWTDYFSAMSTHSQLYLAGLDPRPGPGHFPARVEGVPLQILTYFVPLPFADFSVAGFLRWLGCTGFPGSMIEVAGLALFAAWLWRSRPRPMVQLLPGLAAALFLIDLCLPAYRNIYNDVLILNVTALGLAASPRASIGVALGFLALPLGWAVAAFAPEHNWIIDLPSLLLTCACLALLFRPVPLAFWRKDAKASA